MTKKNKYIKQAREWEGKREGRREGTKEEGRGREGARVKKNNVREENCSIS